MRQKWTIARLQDMTVHLTPENFSPSKHTHIAQILGAVPEDVKAKLMEWKKKDH